MQEQALQTLLAEAGRLRLVLDTNVVMALWHFRDPKLAPLWALLESGRAVAVTRPECLDEFRRVLAYENFKIDPIRQSEILTAYAAFSECLAPATSAQVEEAISLPRCRDRDDQKFVVLAWDASAQILVTRDKLVLKLARRAPLRDRFMICTPETLCRALASRV